MGWSSTWLPAGAAAAAALAAVMLWQGEDGPAPAAQPTLAALEDLDIVAGGEDLDMFDEDEEFYAWAAEQTSDGVG